MFERYTERARRVLGTAQAEAGAFGSPAIESEHLLLGVAEEDLEIIHKLIAPGITLETFRGPIVADSPAGEPVPTHLGLPFSNECKRVLAYAHEEAERLGDRHIRPGHLLLGLAREKGGWAADLLKRAGADLGKMRTRMAAEPRAPELLGDAKGAVRAAMAQPQAVSAVAQVSPPAKASVPQQGSAPLPEEARRLDALDRCSEKAKRAIVFARHQAGQFGKGEIEPEHLLLGMWKEGVWIIHELMGRTTPLPDLRPPLRAHLGPATIGMKIDKPLSDSSRRVLEFAAEESARMGEVRAGIGHLLVGILREKDCFAAQILRQHEADFQAVRKRLAEWSW